MKCTKIIRIISLYIWIYNVHYICSIHHTFIKKQLSFASQKINGKIKTIISTCIYGCYFLKITTMLKCLLGKIYCILISDFLKMIYLFDIKYKSSRGLLKSELNATFSCNVGWKRKQFDT